MIDDEGVKEFKIMDCTTGKVIINYDKDTGWKKDRFGMKGSKFKTGHVTFEISLQHPRGGNE